MNFDEYEKHAAWSFPGKATRAMNKIHAAMGVATEAGELVDALKRHVFYHTPLDIANVEEEIGDLLWYLALMCHATGLSLEEAANNNLQKLRVRYPKGFSKAKAIARADKK